MGSETTYLPFVEVVMFPICTHPLGSLWVLKSGIINAKYILNS